MTTNNIHTLTIMPIQVHYQDHYVHISYDKEVPCLTIRYTGYARAHEHFCEVHQKYYEFLESLCQKRVFPKLIGGLSDLSDAKPASREDTHWLNEVLFPKIYALGYRYSAVLLPKSILAQLVFEDIKNNFTYNNKMTVELFTNVEEAKKWLQGLATSQGFPSI
jgi:hypothetical protein